MLKHIKFSGIFHDDTMYVNVTMENPTEYGLEPTSLLFSLSVKAKSSNGSTDQFHVPKLSDFTFYIMDESNNMYNTKRISIPTANETQITENQATIIQANNEEKYQNNGMMLADFKHTFLYQDLRVAFYYEPYKKIMIINLEH